ncbi:MAG TPA: ATP-binding cassette domain-containing protein [Dongiaceae bacterium]|nr:ATP-binding cassette domain-containing protein [Dongiaceae bacterium]
MAAYPILALSNVRSVDLFGRSAGALDLQLEAGELALIDARDLPLASGFADLCCGLQHPAEGEVRFLQRDWLRQPAEMADALRGLIGRVMANPGWLRFLDATTNVLLQQIHHTRSELDSLREEAARLATHFGLPGLPNGPMAELSPGDQMRVGFVRAFVGEPKLVILESPVQGLYQDMVPALLNRLWEVRDRGGAAIWLTRSRMIWDNPLFPATHRLRLDHQGLSQVKAAA